MIDIPTLSLAMGLGNLAFGALATVYAAGATKTTQQPLLIWRWARMISGIAFLLIWLRPMIPSGFSLTLSHLLLIMAWALEYAAYASLLGRHDWRKPLIVLTGLAILLQLGLHAFSVTRRIDLIYFSLINGGFFMAMAMILLSDRRHGLLVRLMGATNAIAGLLFLGRMVQLLRLDDLAHPGYLYSHIALFVVGYLIIVINGYGFLLLAKQDDDCHLREALADVVQAEAEQRLLLSLASHEFRTPAAMIQASLDSLKFLARDIPPPVATRLDNMRQATQRLIHIANTLITQDRLRELRFGLIVREMDMNDLVAQVVDCYPGRMVWRGLQHALPLLVDVELLEIALHNLIDNAIRHGTLEQPIEIHLQRVGVELQIVVADHGPGVPDADKDAIFERFYRSKAGSGSGLGLSIVRSIARLHHGDATVHDNVPHGSVFIIHLPLTVDAINQTA